jgi:hypothetical protein
MSAVGASGRLGWLEEPSCQSCHTGTATHNNGEIRYTSVFDAPGHVRQAVDQTFATTPNVPLAGLSLYRFSTGHGGLKCEACHGSTHAEFASTHANDNVQSVERQGHVGMLVECGACHGGAQPATMNGGPHGMHPLGQAWVNAHPDLVGEGGDPTPCQSCHGTDYRGTVLSRAQASRTLSGESGTKQVWRGFQIGCYTCHLGPHNGDPNPNRAAVVTTGASVSTPVDVPLPITLSARDPDGNPLTLRIVSQPAHGTTGINGTLATYVPEPGFAGIDSFTFAAWDGSTDSNLGTVTVNVAGSAATATPTPTGTVSAAPTVTLSPRPIDCVGDCSGTGSVTIDELITGVNIALGTLPVSACTAFDFSGNGAVTVDEIIRAVNNASNGC